MLLSPYTACPSFCAVAWGGNNCTAQKATINRAHIGRAACMVCDRAGKSTTDYCCNGGVHAANVPLPLIGRSTRQAASVQNRPNMSVKGRKFLGMVRYWALRCGRSAYSPGHHHRTLRVWFACRTMFQQQLGPDCTILKYPCVTAWPVTRRSGRNLYRTRMSRIIGLGKLLLHLVQGGSA